MVVATATRTSAAAKLVKQMLMGVLFTADRRTHKMTSELPGTPTKEQIGWIARPTSSQSDCGMGSVVAFLPESFILVAYRTVNGFKHQTSTPFQIKVSHMVLMMTLHQPLERHTLSAKTLDTGQHSDITRRIHLMLHKTYHAYGCPGLICCWTVCQLFRWHVRISSTSL